MPIWSTRSPLETKTSKSPSRAARACSARFAAALAEVGTAEACLVLTRNCDAEIAEFSLDRVLERFGDAPAIREALLARNTAASVRASPRDRAASARASRNSNPAAFAAALLAPLTDSRAMTSPREGG